jgi:hypothetical protein
LVLRLEQELDLPEIFGGETTIYYGVDPPIPMDFNIGRKSTNDNEERVGWYFGAGFSYTLTNWTDGSSTEKLNSYGPLFRGDIRLGVGRNNPNKVFSIGLSFKPGLEKTKFKAIGIAVLNEF